MNSLWLVITALAAFLVAYRFYGAFLAAKVAVLNDQRDHARPPAPRRRRLSSHAAAGAVRRPFCRHRRLGPAGRTGAGRTVGLPAGFSWIVVGSCLAGGVHDFVVLLASVRQDGKSLPQIARNLLGPVAGTAATLATLIIIVATLAATAKVVVNALNESAWGMFTIVATIPAALFTGFWMNKDPARPRRRGLADRRDDRRTGRGLRQAVRRFRVPRLLGVFQGNSCRSSCRSTRQSSRSCRSGSCSARAIISVLI